MYKRVFEKSVMSVNPQPDQLQQILVNFDVHNSTWICPKCHSEHDLLVNAARNVLNSGIEKMKHMVK